MIDREKLLDVFEIAIDEENKAYQFYLKAVENTSNPDVKKLLKNLQR